MAETYIRALYELSDNCDFGQSKSENIRDRLFVGIRDKELSKKMQLMLDLTLETAIQMVRQVEDVEEQMSRQLQWRRGERQPVAGTGAAEQASSIENRCRRCG